MTVFMYVSLSICLKCLTIFISNFRFEEEKKLCMYINISYVSILTFHNFHLSAEVKQRWHIHKYGYIYIKMYSKKLNQTLCVY